MADKDDQQEKTIAEDLVVTKYKLAGEIVNRVLKTIAEKCVAGASVRELCALGDGMMLEETSKVFKKEKELKKGIAFPTCLSVNNCICHYSPLTSESDVELKAGDLVKIDLGAHVDGFIAVAAHTVVVGSSADSKVTGRQADALLAAHYASEAALRLMKPDNENVQVTQMVQKVADCFQCKPIEGMLSHQLKQFEIEGEKTIIQNPNEAQRKEHEKAQFELHEVYAVDVLVSTGEGTGRDLETRTTVYKKTNETYMLKMKTSRAFYSELCTKFGNMPFSLRSFDDEKKARMGVVECVTHKLLDPFHVLYEKPNEFVAQFKFTVLLMPNGPQRITGLSFDPTICQSEHSITDEEVKSLLNTSARKKTTKKKKTAAKTAAGNPEVADENAAED